MRRFRTSSIMRNDRSARFIASMTWWTSSISPVASFLTTPSASFCMRFAEPTASSRYSLKPPPAFSPATLFCGEPARGSWTRSRDPAPMASNPLMDHSPSEAERLLDHLAVDACRLQVRVITARSRQEVDHLEDRIDVRKRDHPVLVRLGMPLALHALERSLQVLDDVGDPDVPGLLAGEHGLEDDFLPAVGLAVAAVRVLGVRDVLRDHV